MNLFKRLFSHDCSKYERVVYHSFCQVIEGVVMFKPKEVCECKKCHKKWTK